MDAFAPPSIRPENPGFGGWRLAGSAILTLVLGLSLASFPGAPTTQLDGSWQEMLIHAHAQGLQFGRELIFTWGPWGFLCSGYHLGSVEAMPLLLWQTSGQLLIGLSLVLLTCPLRPLRQLAFAALFLAFHWLFLDTTYFVLISLIVVSGLMGREASIPRLLVWTLVLGFLAQIKFTYFLLASAGILSAMACWASRQSWKRVWALAAGFVLAVVAAWAAAGQNPDNLYPYLRRSLEIASGYGDAMSLDESLPVFLWGSGVAVLCVAFCWRVWRAASERGLALGASAYLAFSFFVMWKEGFTRADGHVLGFFTYVLILAPAAAGLLFPRRPLNWFDAAILPCLAGLASFSPGLCTQAPRIEWQRIQGNAQAIVRRGSLPGDWQRQFDEASSKAALPRIRAAVGSSTVDVYDFNTGIALLNGMNLDPRPIFQSYSAYTPSLEGWNLRFYQSQRAPDFLLWGDERIDNRYPSQDDAMLVAALFGHFEPLFPEGGYWLLRRVSPVSGAPADRRLILSRSVRLNEEVELPAERGHAIWLTAAAVPDNLGRLRALLYKPAAINISTTDEWGFNRTWRLLPRVAQAGFILAPGLEEGDDMAAFLKGESHSWVRSFHFEAPADQAEFWSHVDISVYALPDVPLRPAFNSRTLVRLGIADRAPVSVESVFLPEIFEIPGGRAMLVHAKGEVVFAVPDGASRFEGDFGIREGAFSEGGNTAGVAFRIEAEWASGRTEVLWTRLLDPVNSPGDRGTQHLDVGLPADHPERLVLRTEPATPEDNRWDWSYVSALHFDVPKSP